MNRERLFWIACGLAVILHFVGCSWRVVDRGTASALNVPLGRMLLGNDAPLLVLAPEGSGGIAICSRSGLSREAAFVMGIYIPLGLVLLMVAGLFVAPPAKPEEDKCSTT